MNMDELNQDTVGLIVQIIADNCDANTMLMLSYTGKRYLGEVTGGVLCSSINDVKECIISRCGICHVCGSGDHVVKGYQIDDAYSGSHKLVNMCVDCHSDKPIDVSLSSSGEVSSTDTRWEFLYKRCSVKCKKLDDSELLSPPGGFVASNDSKWCTQSNVFFTAANNAETEDLYWDRTYIIADRCVSPSLGRMSLSHFINMVKINHFMTKTKIETRVMSFVDKHRLQLGLELVPGGSYEKAFKIMPTTYKEVLSISDGPRIDRTTILSAVSLYACVMKRWASMAFAYEFYGTEYKMCVRDSEGEPFLPNRAWEVLKLDLDKRDK